MVTADHPVTGYDDRNRVFSVGIGYGTGGFRVTGPAGQFQVTDRAAKGYLNQFSPDLLLKRSALWMEGKFENPSLAIEILD